MHFLLGGAGLLALIAMAFGERAAVFVAQVVLILGALVALWVAYLVIFNRI